MPQSAVFNAVFEFERRTGASWHNIRAGYDDCASLHQDLAAKISSESREDASIVVFGSLGRYETTPKSDVDWTYLVDGQADAKHQRAVQAISHSIKELGRDEPGPERVFGKIVFSHNLVQHIGGDDDTNANLTRRILLLLESKPIGRRDAYERVIRAVLERYLTNDRGWTNGRTPHKVPRFLHNDIARYWRTVTVDFAYKQWIRDQKKGALRSAKLRFSRKLTYAAGLLYCFALSEELWPQADLPAPSSTRRIEAINTLVQLTALTPLDILAQGFTRASMERRGRDCFEAYDTFLGLLRDEDKHRWLAELTPEQADRDPLFEEVKGLGRRFEHALNELFITGREIPGNPFPALTEVFGVF